MDIPKEHQNQAKLKDILPLYYKRLFPFEQLYKWLSYGGDDQYLSRREFTVTKDEILCRYLSFNNLETFKREIIRRCPDKMDLGAIYNIRPSGVGSVTNFKPMEKELVFDIDATDYKEVLLQKEEGGVIGKTTWNLMATAVKVLDDILRMDFGFQHILWVFSGRRGVHAWVCDKRARLLSTEGRSSIAEFLQVLSGGLQKTHKVNIRATLHPSLKRVYDNYLYPHFEEVLVDEHNLFCDPNHMEHILSFVPDDLKTTFRKQWSDYPDETSLKRWGDFVKTVDKILLSKKMKSNPIQDLVFTYTYPRLDINVSKQIHHLLKSPMVIHPSTGCVCVPIDIEKVDEFEPEKVPTIHSLLEEIDNYKTEEQNESVPDYGKTNLRSYIEIFDKFLDSLLKEIRD